MANIHLQGILVDSVGEIDVGGVITFTHLTTTGDTIASTQTELIIPPDGAYSIDVEYGQIRIDYTTRNTERFVANVIVNSASTATSLPELLSATTPVAKPIIIQMQGLVADATAAATTAEAFADQLTTTELIASSATFAPNTNITTKGYTTSGDGGAGSWVQNGVTGQTVSQSPAQLGNALLNDASGNQWALVTESYITLESVGAVGDGVTDDLLSVIAALESLSHVKPSNKVYAVSDEIEYKNGFRLSGVGTWSTTQQTDETTNVSIFKHIGAGGANSCVFRLSKAAVGTDPNSLGASDRTLMNITLEDVVVDGNDLAEFGVYMGRAWSNNTIRNLAITGTVKHAAWAGRCWNGAHENWFAYKNIGAGITLGKDTFGWGSAPVDQSTCNNFVGLYSGYTNGLVAQNVFDETTNKEKEHGIGVFDCRGLTMITAQGLYNQGAGIYVSPDLYPVTFIGGYAENNGVSTSNLSGKSWDIWIESTANSRNIEFSGTHLGLTPAIRLSGTAPSRGEAAIKFTRLPLINEIMADFDSYYLEDCARGITFSGTLPANNLNYYNSSTTIKDYGVQAHGSFNASTGAIVEDEAIGCSITYTGVGVYTVTLDSALDNAFYSVDCSPASSNRVVFTSNKAAGAFRINYESASSQAATDSGSDLQFAVMGSRTV